MALLLMKYTKIDIIGKITTAAGDIEKISTRWRLRDYLGMIAVRLDINRMNYAIAPGLYAVGEPAKDSPVLVSANYKLSFDVLRRELAGLNLWILVIDTKGVNVWCAAGKGTFGTKEIINRVIVTRVAEIVTTRKLILPQLSAPGVFGHMVQPFCDFNVVYGPVRAKDIKKYLDDGMKADSVMRRVTFRVGERLTVAWLELANAVKQGLVIFLVLLLISAFSVKGWLIVEMLWAGILSGTLLTAVLLPYLPGRPFAMKGGLLGFTAGVFLLCFKPLPFFLFLLLVLFTSAVTAYLALNYTGCTTFTSVAGVKKEVRLALPVIISVIVLSLIGLFVPFAGRM
jgi:hypothetical protein